MNADSRTDTYDSGSKRLEDMSLKKATVNKLALVLSVMLLAALFLSACDSPAQRIPTVYTFNAGGPFATNFNNEDPRRQVRCIVVFEVVDEKAVDELTEHTFVVRNSVLSVLGELTMEELTTHRDLEDISQRLVERVNADVRSNIDLIVGAYFTEFGIT